MNGKVSECSIGELERIAYIISRLPWQDSRSAKYKAHPHSYTVKVHENEELSSLYEELFRFIYGHCYLSRFFSKLYKKIDFSDGYSYWIMTDDITESYIINRQTTELNGAWRRGHNAQNG